MQIVQLLIFCFVNADCVSNGSINLFIFFFLWKVEEYIIVLLEMYDRSWCLTENVEFCNNCILSSQQFYWSDLEIVIRFCLCSTHLSCLLFLLQCVENVVFQDLYFLLLEFHNYHKGKANLKSAHCYFLGLKLRILG